MKTRRHSTVTPWSHLDLRDQSNSIQWLFSYTLQLLQSSQLLATSTTSTRRFVVFSQLYHQQYPLYIALLCALYIIIPRDMLLVCIASGLSANGLSLAYPLSTFALMQSETRAIVWLSSTHWITYLGYMERICFLQRTLRSILWASV